MLPTGLRRGRCPEQTLIVARAGAAVRGLCRFAVTIAPHRLLDRLCYQFKRKIAVYIRPHSTRTFMEMSRQEIQRRVSLFRARQIPSEGNLAVDVTP